jgi:hypothetical protein
MNPMLKSFAAAAAALMFVVPVACQDDKGDNSSSSNTGAGTTTNAGGSGGTGAMGGGPSAGGGNPAGETICDDGIDNDNDGFTDCMDFDCEGTLACPGPIENSDALCADGLDNDEDGLMDCADDSCHGHPDVTVCREGDLGATPAECSDGLDNDQDGFIDCADRDCLKLSVCHDVADSIEAGPVECADGIDNDGDGFTDCADFSCQDSVEACNEATDTVNNCADTVDNNSHSSAANFGNFIDCDAGTMGGDNQCIEWGHCPGTEATDAECSDGITNDSDTFVDCADFSCQRSNVVTVCEGNPRTCADGINNDTLGNFADCDDWACRCCPGENGCTLPKRVVSTCAPCAN